VQNLPEQHATISRKISTFRNQKTPENASDLPLFVVVLLSRGKLLVVQIPLKDGRF
jgi:hypothetical protein